jgi:uncharacterized coiled-coil protein SlyX
MTEKSTFEKNLEMWEKFVNTNMDLMFKSMEKTMEGSKAFQEQVSKAVDRTMEESQTVQDRVSQTVSKTIEGSRSFQEQVAKAVNAAMTAQMDATVAVLKSLERQVGTLSEKVDEFVESQKKDKEA